MKLKLILLLTPIALLLPAAELDAERGDCGWCNFPTPACDKFEHKVPDENPMVLADPHDTCALSVMSKNPCPHSSCGGEEEQEEDQQQLVQLWEAVARGDTELIASVANQIPDRVTFNLERNSIQVLDCSGAALVMNIPLGALSADRVRSLVSDRLAD